MWEEPGKFPSESVWSWKEAVLEHYWISRGFFAAGVLMTILIPAGWILVPLALLVDFLYSDPEIPVQGGVTPRTMITLTIVTLQREYRTWIKPKPKPIKKEE